MNNRKGFLRALLALGALALIGAALLIHRGFRANSTPTAAEAFLARKIRNFAIPHSERAAQNTFDPSPDNLQESRTLFLAHCASCHDIDGSARTQPGGNLYPRVPDLRAAQTQNISCKILSIRFHEI